MSEINYDLQYTLWHNKSDEHFEKMGQISIQLLEKHLPRDFNANILDIGCGYGFALYGLKKRGYKNLYGLETSESQANVAIGRGLNVKLVNDTIKELNSSTCTYDLVILLDVIEHIPVSEQIRFLQSIKMSLKDGGKLVLTTPNANSILAYRWRNIDFTHHSTYTEHSLRFILLNAGFKDVWMDNFKLGKMPLSFWKKGYLRHFRKWLVRYCWLQVFKVEQPNEDLNAISFELNHYCVATK